MHIIWKREWQSFFHTPVGYAFIGAFLSLSGLVFYLNHLQSLSGELLSFLPQLTLCVMLLTPLLTMRLLCEERQKRTDQLLLTSPVSLTQIVLGKYFAAAAIMLMAVFFTQIYVLVILLYGKVYLGEWFVGYLGLVLQSLSFLALDLLVTCGTKNQVSAAIAAFAANFVLWMLDQLAAYATIPFFQRILGFISLYDRYEPFILGQLSYASVLFFLSFIAVCLTATIHILDARRFSQRGAA